MSAYVLSNRQSPHECMMHIYLYYDFVNITHDKRAHMAAFCTKTENFIISNDLIHSVGTRQHWQWWLLSAWMYMRHTNKSNRGVCANVWLVGVDGFLDSTGLFALVCVRNTHESDGLSYSAWQSLVCFTFSPSKIAIFICMDIVVFIWRQSLSTVYACCDRPRVYREIWVLREHTKNIIWRQFFSS